MSNMSKIVLITGATAGIGRITALHLARQGHHVIATGRKLAELAKLKEEAAGLKLDTLVLDVTSARSIATAVAEVDAAHRRPWPRRARQQRGLRHPRTDVGDRRRRDAPPVRDQRVRPDERHARVPAEDAGAPLGPHHQRVERRRPASRCRYFGVYNSTKYAVESLSDALRYELRPFGIDVSLIEPGVIRTNFEATADHGPRRVRGHAVRGGGRASTRRCRRWRTGSRRTRS